MGKIVSPIQFVGKLGNVVGFRGQRGTVRIRPHVDSIANPQTPAQLMQRAKINLCGQLSAITPAAALAPLQMGTKAANRNEFQSRNIRNTQATYRTDGSVLANLPDRLVTFSHGSVQPLAAASALQVTANAVNLTLTLRDENEANFYGERVVAVISKASAEQVYDTVIFADTILTSTAATQVSIPIPVELTENKHIAVYRLPFRLSTQGRSLITEDMIGNAAALTAVIAAQRSAVQDWGETVYHASTVFTAG